MPEPELHPNIRHSCWDAGRHGMGGNRIKHRVVLVRHGESKQNREFVTSGVGESGPEGPELTDIGSYQAAEVGSYLTEAGFVFDTIEVSPIPRAIETASHIVRKDNPSTRLKFDLRERRFGESLAMSAPDSPWMSEDPELYTGAWVRPQESMDGFRARVDQLLDRWRRTGTPQDRRQTLAITHSLLISQILGDIDNGPHFQISNGSITVIDFVANGDMHVHVVNKTDHLTNPTGHHTPFTAFTQ